MSAHVYTISRAAQAVRPINVQVLADGLTTREDVIDTAMTAAGETRSSLFGWDTTPPKDSFCDEFVTVTLYRD